MQGIFFGLPRSGKTSTKKRLVGKRPSLQQASTGVAEKISRVEIEKSTVQFVSQSIWNEVIDLDEEAAIVVEDIAGNMSRNDNHPSSGVRQESTMEPQSPPPRTNLLPNIVRKVKSMFVKKKRTVETLPDADTKRVLQSGNRMLSTHPMQILDFAVQRSTNITHQEQDLQCTLYLSDAGGQPEFQEMLSALVSGPSLYFLTFPLHKGLNEKCLVEYQHSNGSSIVPFEASSTMKEVLHSSLASIASTRSYTRVEDGKDVVPKVLFIATQKDKLESEQQLLQIDQELQEAVKKTAAYRENMIEFHSKFQMVFDLNNISDSDEDIQRVRDAVQQIGTRNEDYRIQTPYPWMIFAITLRHLPGKVLSIDECMLVGKECGIDTQDELNDALWFLHHNVGIIRHFQEIPDLQDIVIKEPQYIFDKLTELIINTFTFKAVGQRMHEEFTKKGIFPTDTFKKISAESDALTGDKFTILLEHLNIITPIEEDGKVVKYFAPCALAHAELPPDTQSKAVIPPIRVTFESGYCPKGMFGSLVVKLLKKDKMSQFGWELKQDRIYRDQICLSIGPYDSFQLTLSSMYIEISLDTTTKHHRKVPLGRVCCDVRCEVESSIRSVTEALHYTQKAAHSLAFACPEPPPHDQSHAATINFSPEGEPCTLTCPLTKNLYDLPVWHMFWFDEVSGCDIVNVFTYCT